MQKIWKWSNGVVDLGIPDRVVQSEMANHCFRFMVATTIVPTFFLNLIGIFNMGDTFPEVAIPK